MAQKTQRPVWDTSSQDVEHRETARRICRKNYSRLKSNVSGAWFSFGDEESIKKALNSLLKTKHGQNIIANIDSGISIESSNFMSDTVHATFSSDGKLRINTDKIAKEGPIIQVAHELLHAKQHYLGETEVKGFSPAQVVTRYTLMEAEAEGWDRVHQALLTIFGTIAPSKKSVELYMNKKVETVLKNEALALAQTPEGDVYRFTKALYENYPDIYEAERMFVGSEITSCLKAFSNDKLKDRNTKWRALYNAQALKMALHGAERNFLTPKGNSIHFLNHVNRLALEYNVDPQILMRLNLSKTELSVFQNITQINQNNRPVSTRGQSKQARPISSERELISRSQDELKALQKRALNMR